jgi:hypothetical protein
MVIPDAKIRGTALVTLNKVGGNPVSYNIYITNSTGMTSQVGFEE